MNKRHRGQKYNEASLKPQRIPVVFRRSSASISFDLSDGSAVVQVWPGNLGIPDKILWPDSWPDFGPERKQ